MRGGLDRLQKEMDALTYNSRSVLNALIRSTVVSGSSEGYSVIRVTETITLTRVDIYRLYRFYQEWEVNQFATDSDANGNSNLKGFSTIIAEQDLTPVRDENGNPTSDSTTSAVVKHSKILYMNDTNIDQTNVDQYWLGLIENANNPKLVSNSSPIPINLRTPVFDENLATTRYNQHPTYLFPNAYYILDAFGYSGDGIDHRLDGQSWTIGGDEFVRLISPQVAMGDIDSRNTRKTWDRRNGELDDQGNPRDAYYSTVWGYNTHARGKYSTAGGRNSMVSNEALGAISMGVSALSSNNGAAVVGGTTNIGAGRYIGVMSGTYNNVVADRGGILAGRSNVVGGPVYTFGFPFDNISDPTCVIVESDCTAEEVTSGTVFGRNTITVRGNYTSSFRIGDIVRLFRFTTKSSDDTKLEFYEVGGDAFATQDSTLISIEYVDPETNPDNLNAGYTIITISDDVVGAGIVDGGRISRLQSATNDFQYGENSVALNYNNIAMGPDQTVVGRNNYIDVTARFIVGAGTTSSRGNNLEIRDSFASIQATPRNATMRYGEDGYSGIEILSDAIYSSSGGDSQFLMSDFRTFMGYGNQTGLNIYRDHKSYSTVLTGNSNSALVIKSGPFVSAETYDNVPEIRIVSEDAAYILTSTDIVMRSDTSNIILRAATDISLSWDGILRLSGETFGSLPTDDSSYCHSLTTSNIGNYTFDGSSQPGRLFRTGFYHMESNLGGQLAANFPEMGLTGDNTELINNVYSKRYSNGSIEGFEIFSSTYSSDALQGAGKVYVNKFAVTSSGHYRSRGSKALAWWDDVKDWGVWTDAVPSSGSMTVQRLKIGDQIDYNSTDNRSEIRDIVKNLTYTIINDTVIINLRIDYSSVINYFGSFFTGGNIEPIEIYLNSSLFPRDFSSDGMTPGGWDVLTTNNDIMYKARTLAGRRIIAEHVIDSSLLGSADGLAQFTLIDQLNPA